MGVVQQPIQQRCRQRGTLREGRIPLAERQVAGHDQAAAFVTRGNHLEEQVGLFTAHRQVADFVDDQQPLAGRYIRQGAFFDLIQSGHIGAYADTSPMLSTLVEVVLNGNRAVVAAVQSSLTNA